MLYCIKSLNTLRYIANVKYYNKDYHIQHSILASFIVKMAFFKGETCCNIIYKGKGKGEGHPRTGHEGPKGE